jgi:hypothetical protein
MNHNHDKNQQGLLGKWRTENLKEAMDTIERGKSVLEHTFDKPIRPSHQQDYIMKTWPTWNLIS